MRKVIVLLVSLLAFSAGLTAQGYRLVVVKAGTKVVDYFPLNERYRYPDFIPGTVVFKSGKSSDMKFNYNLLFSEIEFVQAAETLSITKKKDLRYVAAQDTFYYDNGFIEIISGGQMKVGLKQYYKIRDVLKSGAYGTTVRSGSADTYNSISANGLTYGLIPNEDIELQKMIEYYLYTPSNGYTLFIKKNVLQLFPERSDEIKAYLKANKVDFDSRDDLLRFADFLRTL
jgi:hypothetical protein